MWRAWKPLLSVYTNRLCSWLIPAVNKYAFPKNCVVYGISLRLTNCWLEKPLPLFRTIALYCIGLICQQKQDQKILIQWKYVAKFLHNLPNIFIPLKHVQVSIKLYLNRKNFKFYTRKNFCSSKAIAYNAAFFNIKFFIICFLYIIQK